ncbi:MAG: hypothetical protein PHS49_04535 [Candidatus Gracilibacteria bacterium]|nr:hypothetical protein [Candidatus Gracilibacteria bacterium]
MNFIKQEIKPKIIGIIDIGTYKIRVGICKIINRDVELIGYGEKRQDEEYVMMQEIQNLKGVAENISLAIKKAERDGDIKVEDVIINIPTTNLFFEFAQINHIRENLSKNIDDNELYDIMKIVETLALKKHFKTIKENSGYKKNDLKLIISNISKIYSDKIETKVLVGTNPTVVNISILNVFIPESKYETISYIKKAIGKNIVNVIPSEFAITGLFKEVREVVIIDIGNSHTSIIVKKNDNIKGAKKLAFGINDLIKQIRKNYNLTKNDIIQTIDMDRFTLEKANFLSIFKDVLVITLEEILGKEICPNNFFMIGGGANKFIKNYLSSINLNESNLKIIGNVSFINPKIDFLDDKIEGNEDWIDGAKSNVNIFAMIKTTLDFIKKDKNKIEKTLKQVIHDLEA